MNRGNRLSPVPAVSYNNQGVKYYQRDIIVICAQKQSVTMVTHKGFSGANFNGIIKFKLPDLKNPLFCANILLLSLMMLEL